MKYKDNLKKLFSISKDLRSKDLLLHCLDGTDLLCIKLDEARCALDQEAGEYWELFTQSPLSFKQFSDRMIDSPQFTERFNFFGDAALRYRGRCFNFSYIEFNHSFTFAIHEEVVKLLNLSYSQILRYHKPIYRINPQKLVKFDNHLAKLCDEIKALKSWHRDPLYPTCQKHFKYIYDRIIDEIDEFEGWTTAVSIELTASRNIEIEFNQLYISSSFPLSRTRQEIEKLLNKLKERNAAEKKRLFDQKNEWCKAISSYVKGELKDDTTLKCSDVRFSSFSMDDDLHKIIKDIDEGKKLEDQTHLKVKYILETVKPLLNTRICSKIDFCNYIDIRLVPNAKDDSLDDLNVSLTLAQNDDWDDFTVKKTFKANEEFENAFRAWWHLALLRQLKWLKSELAQ